MNYPDKIKKIVNDKINPESINIIDNSALHSKHKHFSPDKFHLKLIITSAKLKKMRQIDAHKLVFSILKDEMKYKIHALEIELK
jgi:BolA family transcriptional regulator, general stress-responsive regulator